MNENAIETILVTGASGFVGRHLLNILCQNYHIYAIARRTQKEAGVIPHENIDWYLNDITDQVQLEKTFKKIQKERPIDYIVHLAAYYDFGDQKHNEIYEKTNVTATKQLLELTQMYGVKRFIFTSSLVASKFPKPGEVVYEDSILDADFPYAITKQKGEEFMRQYSEFFPCTIVRLAAVCSDWCEYEPLYYFLKTWLSNRWDSRILPGKGEMAIPYIHVCCVVNLLQKIIKQSAQLPKLNILLASSDEPISLLDLFKLSTRHYYGEEKSPIFIPKWFAKLGVAYRDLYGRITGNRPFERLWMMKYIDRKFPTDSSYTRQLLQWDLKSRHHLSRRMLHLIENLKSVPEEWHLKNISRVERFMKKRPALTLAEVMHHKHEELVEKVFAFLTAEENAEQFRYYQQLETESLRWYINVVYNNLLTSVRHGDRSIMINFGRDLAQARLNDNVELNELCMALDATRNIISRGLYDDPHLTEEKLLIHDYITLAIQLAIDEIKDVYEQVAR